MTDKLSEDEILLRASGNYIGDRSGTGGNTSLPDTTISRYGYLPVGIERNPGINAFNYNMFKLFLTIRISVSYLSLPSGPHASYITRV